MLWTRQPPLSWKKLCTLYNKFLELFPALFIQLLNLRFISCNNEFALFSSFSCSTQGTLWHWKNPINSNSGLCSQTLKGSYSDSGWIQVWLKRSRGITYRIIERKALWEKDILSPFGTNEALLTGVLSQSLFNTWTFWIHTDSPDFQKQKVKDRKKTLCLCQFFYSFGKLVLTSQRVAKLCWKEGAFHPDSLMAKISKKLSKELVSLSRIRFQQP